MGKVVEFFEGNKKTVKRCIFKLFSKIFLFNAKPCMFNFNLIDNSILNKIVLKHYNEKFRINRDNI